MSTPKQRLDWALDDLFKEHRRRTAELATWRNEQAQVLYEKYAKELQAEKQQEENHAQTALCQESQEG